MLAMQMRLASAQALDSPPSRGAKNSPARRSHCGSRRRVSFMTPPSSNRITGFAPMLASFSEGVFCSPRSGYHRAACACKQCWLPYSAFSSSSGFSSLCTPSLRLTDFDEALHADCRQAAIGLHAQMEVVEAFAIAIDLEVDDVPGRIRLGPLWRRPLQEFNETRAIPLGSPLQGKERPSRFEDAVHFPWTKGDRTSEHQIKGVVCKGEASMGPLSLWLRAARIRTGGIGPDDLYSKRSKPSGCLRDIGRIGFRGHCHLGERG